MNHALKVLKIFKPMHMATIDLLCSFTKDEKIVFEIRKQTELYYANILSLFESN